MEATAAWAGQFGVGLVLGVVWSPCVGPTLGAASLLAAQERDLGSVALTMALFGIGAAVPMLLIGSLSRHTMARLKGRLLSTGTSLKVGLGALLVIFGVLTLSGLDRTLETALVDASPAWLTAASTRFRPTTPTRGHARGSLPQQPQGVDSTKRLHRHDGRSPPPPVRWRLKEWKPMIEVRGLIDRRRRLPCASRSEPDDRLPARTSRRAAGLRCAQCRRSLGRDGGSKADNARSDEAQSKELTCASGPV